MNYDFIVIILGDCEKLMSGNYDKDRKKTEFNWKKTEFNCNNSHNNDSFYDGL